jgi:hypothetical protein
MNAFPASTLPAHIHIWLNKAILDTSQKRYCATYIPWLNRAIKLTPPLLGSVEPFFAGLNRSIRLTIVQDTFQMSVDMDGVPVVGTMWVLSAHDFLMYGRTYQALVQIMEDIAKGKSVHAEDWEIVWNWMQMMEAQVAE